MDIVQQAQPAPNENGVGDAPPQLDLTEIVAMLGQMQEQTAATIAASNDQLVQAITAPRQMITPDGRAYTSQPVATQ